MSVNEDEWSERYHDQKASLLVVPHFSPMHPQPNCATLQRPLNQNEHSTPLCELCTF